MSPKSRRQLFSAAFIVVGVASVLITNDGGIRWFQNLLKIPGSQFQIGSAKVIKSDNWILLSSRATEFSSVKILGVFPAWMLHMKNKWPAGRYFSFQSGSKRSDAITFIETRDEITTLLRHDFPAIQGASAHQSECYWVNSQFAKLRSAECKSATYSIIYLPDAHVTIVSTLMGENALNQFEIKLL